MPCRPPVTINGQREAVILLLDNKASIEAGGGRGPALVAAACDGNADVMRTLLDRGANVNARGTSGMTALFCAARRFDVEVIQLLLDRKTDVNALTTSGYSPLNYLLNQGSADPKADQRVNANALLLIERGADVNVINSDGDTPLRNAVLARRTDVVRALLARGADPNKKDRSGDTLLIWALGVASWPEGNFDIARLLIDFGADVNAMGRAPSPPGIQTTPLILAIQAKQTDLLRALLAKGANPNQAQSNGHTPLKAASGAPEIMQLLINAGAK